MQTNVVSFHSCSVLSVRRDQEEVNLERFRVMVCMNKHTSDFKGNEYDKEKNLCVLTVNELFSTRSQFKHADI